MQKTLIIVTIAVVCLSGCKRSRNSPRSNSGDPVQQKLQELAGGDAHDCGRLQTQAPEELKPASDCAVQAAQSKHPFYVAYEMPGLTVGVSGDAGGKLYFVQAEQPQSTQPGEKPVIKSGICPSQLRVALSGRVTCFAAGAMGSGTHGGMPIPPIGVENPHDRTGPPPTGTPKGNAADSSTNRRE